MRLLIALPLTLLLTTPALAQTPARLYGIDDEDYWRDRCHILIGANALETARIACEQALGIEPNDDDLWLTYTALLQQLDEPAEALVAIYTAINEGADDSPSYLAQCQIQVTLEQYDEALASCDDALAHDRHWGTNSPDDAWEYRGLALAGMEDWEGAIASYNHVIHLDPDRSGFRTRRCEALNYLGKPREALINCDAALGYNQDWGNTSPEMALYHRAIALAQIGDPDRAIAAYDLTLSADDTSFDRWLEQGLLLAAQNHNDDSLHALEQAVRLNPSSSKAHVFRCDVLNRLERHSEALEACELAIAGDGTWGPLGIGQVWDQQSISHAHLGNFDTALALSNRAVGFLPTYAPAWAHQAAIHWHLEQYEQAIAASNQALTIDRSLVTAWFNQAIAYRSQGDYEPALQAYDEVVALAPQQENAWANRSVILWYLQRYEEAIDSADEAIARQPDSYIGWYNRGTALASLGHFQDALIAYNEALTKAPNHPDILAGQGHALYALGQTNDALEALETAIRINPDHSLTYSLLIEIEENLNHTERGN
ncbi:MAG: tetratricopeptide repeat protein [Cyanobacteria bacterium P01_E01_bin.6]